MKNKFLFPAFIVLLSSVAIFSATLATLGVSTVFSHAPTRLNPEDVPDHKRFFLENYLTSKAAYDLIRQDPDILFIDVRDPVEVAIKGLPAPVDAVVPLRVQSEVYDATLDEYTLEDNPDFLSSLGTYILEAGKSPHDMIIVTCGSGLRSAAAAQRMADAGYTNVWHIPDGYHGEEKRGMNSENAWKLAGLPWSDALVPGMEWRRLITY